MRMGRPRGHFYRLLEYMVDFSWVGGISLHRRVCELLVPKRRSPQIVITELCELRGEDPVDSSTIAAKNHDNHASLALGNNLFHLRRDHVTAAEHGASRAQTFQVWTEICSTGCQRRFGQV